MLNKQNLKTAGIGLGAGLLGNIIGNHLGIDHSDVTNHANEHISSMTNNAHQTISDAAKNIANHAKDLLNHNNLNNSNNYNASSDGYGIPNINHDQSHDNQVEHTNNTHTNNEHMNNENNQQAAQQTDILSKLNTLNQQYQQIESQEQQIQNQINSLKNYIEAVLNGEAPANAHYQNALQQLKELEAKYKQLELQKETLEDQIDNLKDTIKEQINPGMSLAQKITYGTLAGMGVAGLAKVLSNKTNTPRNQLKNVINTNARGNSTIRMPYPSKNLSQRLKNIQAMRSGSGIRSSRRYAFK